MGDASRAHLVVLQGGRAGQSGPPVGRALSREELRVIPGGPAGGLEAALDEAIRAAQRMRREIEDRIARALEELF